MPETSSEIITALFLGWLSYALVAVFIGMPVLMLLCLAFIGIQVCWQKAMAWSAVPELLIPIPKCSGDVHIAINMSMADLRYRSSCKMPFDDFDGLFIIDYPVRVHFYMNPESQALFIRKTRYVALNILSGYVASIRFVPHPESIPQEEALELYNGIRSRLLNTGWIERNSYALHDPESMVEKINRRGTMQLGSWDNKGYQIILDARPSNNQFVLGLDIGNVDIYMKLQEGRKKNVLPSHQH